MRRIEPGDLAGLPVFLVVLAFITLVFKSCG